MTITREQAMADVYRRLREKLEQLQVAALLYALGATIREIEDARRANHDE